MKREFIINIILLVLINLLIKPAYIFGVEVRIQNLTGTEAYGMYFHYLNLVYLFSFINDPGVQNWNAQYVPMNREQAGHHFVTVSKVKLILFALLALLIAALGYVFNYNIYYLLLLTFNLALSSMFLILRSTIAGLGLYRTDSWLSALDKFLMLIILGYLAWFSPMQNEFTIDLLILGQGLALLISCLIGFVILFKNTKLISSTFRIKEINYVLKSSAPFLLILIFMTAYNKLDGVMLGAMIQDNHHQAGVYAGAIRIYDAANMVAYLFAALLLPMYASNIFNVRILQELQDVGLRFVSAMSGAIVCVLVFFGNEFLDFLYKEQDPAMYHTLLVLIVAFFMVAVAYIFGTLLVAAGKLRKVTQLFGVGLILNFILNLLLIPKFQATGAAIATLITQTTVMVGQIYLVKAELKLGISNNTFLAVILYVAIAIISTQIISMIHIFPWYVNLMLCGLICIILSLVTGLIQLSSGKIFLKKRQELTDNP